MKTINLTEDVNKETVAYYDKNIAIVNGHIDPRFMEEKLLIDGVAIILIQKGHVQFSLNQQPCRMHQGDLLVCRPRNILEDTMVSVDIQCIGFFLSIPFAQKIMERVDMDIIRLSFTTSRHIVHLTDQQQDVFVSYIRLLQAVMNIPSEARHKEKAVQSLFHSFTYLITDIGESSLPEAVQPTQARTVSTTEETVRKFLQMLANPETRTRSVYSYSDSLNITSKYLSTLCKNVTGKSAGQLITEAYVHEARLLLQNPTYSIKQIADRLGFKNQSHFGAFMRKHTGKSPILLRKA